MQNEKYISPGFVRDELKESDYVFGSTRKIPDEILNESGDWRPYLPALEVQRKAFDTYSCVSFANNNVCEMMHKKRYGEEVNYSDRFLSVISGTVPGRGNSHNSVAEAKRKKGIVLEVECPFPDNMSQHAFFQKIPKELQDLGFKWTEEYEYGYEKVGRGDFKEALKRSPIQVAVDSRTNKTSKYRSADHSVVLIAKDEANYIFDSYLNRFVSYDLDYPFSFGLRVHYKKVLNLNLEDMKMQLIRNQDTGHIYLVDSDNKIHHVELEPDFKEIFGEKAWKDKDWVNMPKEEIEKYSEGVSLSSRKVAFIDQLKDLFAKFGKKI